MSNNQQRSTENWQHTFTQQQHQQYQRQNQALDTHLKASATLTAPAANQTLQAHLYTTVTTKTTINQTLEAHLSVLHPARKLGRVRLDAPHVLYRGEADRFPVSTLTQVEGKNHESVKP